MFSRLGLRFVGLAAAVASSTCLGQAQPAWTNEFGRYLTGVYLGVLGRSSPGLSPIDEGGWQFWLNDLNANYIAPGSNQTASDFVVGQFMSTQEYTGLRATFQNANYYGCSWPGDSNGQFLTMLYWYMFARCPDAGGYQFFWNAMQGGTTPADIVACFVENSEFASKQGAKASALLAGQTYWNRIQIVDSPVPSSDYMPTASAVWFGQSPGGSETVHQGDYATYRIDFTDNEGSAELSLVGTTIGLSSAYSGNCSIQFLPGSQQLSVLDASGHVYASGTIGQGESSPVRTATCTAACLLSPIPARC